MVLKILKKKTAHKLKNYDEKVDKVFQKLKDITVCL